MPGPLIAGAVGAAALVGAAIVANATRTKSAARTDATYGRDLFYRIRPGNWYKTFPFFFEIRLQVPDKTDGHPIFRFFLPIPPQNMTVQDMSTSEAHATIGGVVEETSSGVFNMITLTGTTGLSSNALNLSTNAEDNNTLTVAYRKYVDDLTGQANPLSKLVGNLVNGVTNLVTSGLGDAEGQLPYGRSGSAIASSNASTSVVLNELSAGSSTAPTKGNLAATLGKMFTSAIAGQFNADEGDYKTIFANGYTWSHALRQLFLVYQREKSEDTRLGLYFVDVKSNTSYRCVVRSAQFTQNAKDPYIIFYNISLKCWNLKDAEESFQKSEIDRFGENGDLKEVYTANITASITSVGNTIRNFRRPGGVAGAMVKNSTSSII